MSLFLTKTHESFHLNGSMEVLCRKPGKKTLWLSFITSKHFLPWRKSRESLLLDVGVVNGNICAASVGPKKIITVGPPLSSTHATNYLWPCFRKFDVSLEDCRFKCTVQHVVWARYEELTQVTFGFKLWIVPNGQKVCKVIYWFLHNWSEVYHTMVDVLVKDLSSNSCYFPKKVKTRAKVVVVIVNFNIKIGLWFTSEQTRVFNFPQFSLKVVFSKSSTTDFTLELSQSFCKTEVILQQREHGTEDKSAYAIYVWFMIFFIENSLHFFLCLIYVNDFF